MWDRILGFFGGMFSWVIQKVTWPIYKVIQILGTKWGKIVALFLIIFVPAILLVVTICSVVLMVLKLAPQLYGKVQDGTVGTAYTGALAGVLDLFAFINFLIPLPEVAGGIVAVAYLIIVGRVLRAMKITIPFVGG